MPREFPAEVEKFAEGDGILRDYPPALTRKFRLAKALAAAARRLSEEVVEEVELFLETIDPPPYNEGSDKLLAPCAENELAHFLGLRDDTRFLPETRMPFCPEEASVRSFIDLELTDEATDGGQQR